MHGTFHVSALASATAFTNQFYDIEIDSKFSTRKYRKFSFTNQTVPRFIDSKLRSVPVNHVIKYEADARIYFGAAYKFCTGIE